MPPAGGVIGTASTDLDARRYRITAVLGKGGSGKVYRAVLEGPGGFTKDVAIKLLRDEDVPELALMRFRDEARILGLVRDRAIVNVDPPTRLAGRWAVVMEYVDGASLQRLMSLGPMPPSVAAEIAQEVARVLDKVYRTTGPQGEPLRILHRDIKPANIQVTPDGEVKVLDFGIAKADFTAREASTNAYVGGTRGYIAPERLEGTDSPAGDVYSLGVTLHFLITGERPTRRQVMGLDDVDALSVDAEARTLLSLAARMRDADPESRPSAREVEEALSAIRHRSDGPTLRLWAEKYVPRAVALKFSDEMVGSVLSETLASGMQSDDRIAAGYEIVLEGQRTGELRGAPTGSRVNRLALTGVATAVVLLIGLTLGAAAAVLGLVLFSDLMWRSEPPPPVVIVAPGVPEEVPVEVVEPPPVPSVPESIVPPTPSAEPERSVAPPAPEEPREPTTGPNDRGREVARVKPDPVPQTPASGAETRLTFSSVPLGADVLIDGKFVGQTPLFDIVVTTGPHQVKMVSDADTLIRNIDVGRRNPVRYVWKGGETWELHY